VIDEHLRWFELAFARCPCQAGGREHLFYDCLGAHGLCVRGKGDQKVVDKYQNAEAGSSKGCDNNPENCYPNARRSCPPEWRDCVSELDNLDVGFAQARWGRGGWLRRARTASSECCSAQ